MNSVNETDDDDDDMAIARNLNYDICTFNIYI